MDNQNQINQPTPNPLSAQDARPLSRPEKLKRTFFQVLIACLLGAAAIAVIAVLIGSFSDILGRALGTIAVVALHALLGFSYINQAEKHDKKDGGRSIELFSNTVFALITISFITSVFAIWQLLSGEIAFKLYLLYAVILFATLHADVLYRIRGFEKRIDTIVAVNYIFIATVVAMLTIIIFSSTPSDLGEFFYRLLAAAGIVDATVTITAVIMHKMYLQKHPEIAAQGTQADAARSKNFWKNPLVVLLLIFLAFQVVGTLIGLVLRGF